ncbi:hypothetical protein [Streptomyces sp. NPDC020571]|uniref:hypothetical protein n=1 Tax=Streptomyces sp. NPDC020571 TaxID=3365079 RepID=UPI0037A8A10B
MAAALTSPVPELLESGGRFVLAGRPLAPGHTLEGTARYGDALWSLAPGLLQRQQARACLDFTRAPTAFVPALKDFFAAALSGRLPPNEPRPKMMSIRRHFTELLRFTHWVAARPGRPQLADLTVDDFAAYALYLHTVLPAEASREVAQSAVRLLYRYRTVLTGDRLIVDPRDCEQWGNSTRRTHAENTTLRIPEQVMGPLLTWCLRIVDDLAPDILDLLDADRAHKAAGRHMRRRPRIRFSAAWPHQSPVPGRTADQPPSDDRFHPISLARLLQGACYILIAYLSGMRDSEVKHLRPGSTHALLDGSGHPYRWTITSLAFKGEHDPAGTTATWIIGAPAARAVTALERLQPPGSDLLFGGLRQHSRARPGAMTLRSSNELINNVITWINTYCRHHHLTDTIPDVNGTPWNLTARQFRRTLAWYVARRPGGVIAGAVQYRHLGIQMFEGYAGTSDSGFRAEVEAEQAMQRGEHLLALTTDHQHDLRGPAATEAAARLADFHQRTGFTGSVITDPRRLRRVLAHHDPEVYPGTYATCVFNPDKALCRPRAAPDGDRALPVPLDCRPLECRNVALTADNATALTAQAERLDTRLRARPVLAPLLHADLQRRRDAIRAFLTTAGEAAQ